MLVWPHARKQRCPSRRTDRSRCERVCERHPFTAQVIQIRSSADPAPVYPERIHAMLIGGDQENIVLTQWQTLF